MKSSIKAKSDKVRRGSTLFSDDLTRTNSSEPWLGNNGEINASSKKELLATMTQLMEAAAEHNAVLATDQEGVNREQAIKAKREMLVAC